VAPSHGAFEDNRNSFRELEWKTLIFCGREVRKAPNPSHLGGVQPTACAEVSGFLYLSRGEALMMLNVSMKASMESCPSRIIVDQ
jgi:hypothetical protein